LQGHRIKLKRKKERKTKQQTKLPILHMRIWQWATEMEITVRYGYAASTGVLAV